MLLSYLIKKEVMFNQITTWHWKTAVVRYSMVMTYQVTIHCLQWYLYRLWEHMDVRWGKIAHVSGSLSPQFRYFHLKIQVLFVAVVSVSEFQGDWCAGCIHTTGNTNAKLPCIHSIRFGSGSEKQNTNALSLGLFYLLLQFWCSFRLM